MVVAVIVVVVVVVVVVVPLHFRDCSLPHMIGLTTFFQDFS